MNLLGPQSIGNLVKFVVFPCLLWAMMLAGEVRVSAAFANGGFELGTGGQPPSNWTVMAYSNTVGVTIQSPQTLAGLNLQSGGYALTTTLHAIGPLTQPDPTLGYTTSLHWPRYGNNCVLINQMGANRNVNGLTQVARVGAADIDPVDGKIHVRFVIAPVLQDAGHLAPQEPYYFLQLQNLTWGTVLYENFGALSDTTIPWQSVTNGTTVTRFTDWQLVDVHPGSGISMGDQIQLLIIASGCQPGGHFGELYVDGVGAVISGISVEGTAPSTVFAGENLTYTLSYRNNSSSSENAVVINFNTPANTTFVSATALAGWVINPPPPGSSGTVTATAFSPVPAGGSGSFTVTVNVNSAATGTVTARNYGISSQQEGEPLLGPGVVTSIVYPIVLGQPTVSTTNHTFSCQFTNSPRLNFTALCATNLSTPFSQWTPSGSIVESPSGTYTLSDSATKGTCFYRVTAQ